MAGAGGTTNNALQAQINALGETMQNGFKEMKELLQGIEQRVRGIETQEAGCAPLVNQRLKAVEDRVKEHADQLGKLSKIVTELAQTNTILKWLLGLLTVILGAVLVGLVTGQVQLLFK
jgi:hypothetical protein